MEADFNNATLDDALEDALFSYMLAKRHCLPGKVSAFDPVTQTITAEVMVSSETETGERVPLPPVGDVPILQLGGGGYNITFNPAPGDHCILLVADRCIDGWFETGENRVPDDFRQNDLSDCIAIVGLFPKVSSIPNLQEGVTIRKTDGSYFININNAGKVSIKATEVDLTTTPTLTASNTPATFKEVIWGGGIKATTHKHTGVEKGSDTSGTPTN